MSAQGSDQSMSQSKPSAGIVQGRFISRIACIEVMSGDRPPWTQLRVRRGEKGVQDFI